MCLKTQTPSSLVLSPFAGLIVCVPIRTLAPTCQFLPRRAAASSGSGPAASYRSSYRSSETRCTGARIVSCPLADRDSSVDGALRRFTPLFRHCCCLVPLSIVRALKSVYVDRADGRWGCHYSSLRFCPRLARVVLFWSRIELCW